MGSLRAAGLLHLSAGDPRAADAVPAPRAGAQLYARRPAPQRLRRGHGAGGTIRRTGARVDRSGAGTLVRGGWHGAGRTAASAGPPRGSDARARTLHGGARLADAGDEPGHALGAAWRAADARVRRGKRGRRRKRWSRAVTRGWAAAGGPRLARRALHGRGAAAGATCLLPRRSAA